MKRPTQAAGGARARSASQPGRDPLEFPGSEAASPGGIAMPVHDWSRVDAGTFHHFHSLWIAEISNALNDGLLPPDYYAMAEQVVGGTIPDVLTLQSVEPPGG